MDIERFIQLLTDPRRTEDELKTMLQNAIQKGETEFARVAKIELDRRFPGWDSVRSKRAGATPTRAEFRGTTRHFETAKEAYAWLIERFIQVHPQPFVNVNWETEFVAKGRSRNYFGRNVERMFHGSPHLAEDPNNYARLTNGWYANLNLSNEQKFTILCKFSAVGEFTYGKDWKWEIEGRCAANDLDFTL